MAKLALVKCRLCGGAIDRNIEKENVDWIMPSRNWFYHKSCYESWKKAEGIEKDENWIPYIYDFISRDLKENYDWHVCEAQRKKFLKQGMTNKGIFFSLKYFYEVKHGDWKKGFGGIGIVPYIYNDSCAYWAAREKQNNGTLKRIEQQIKELSNQPKKTIKRNIKKKESEIDFSIVEEMENDE